MGERISGLVLAGGLSRRFAGEDKGWQLYRGRPLIEHALGQIEGLDEILISVNHDAARYASLGHRVIGDRRPGRLGPLSGIETALLESGAEALLVIPCDVLGAPAGWAQELIGHAHALQSPWVGTSDGDRLQPLLGYWSASLLPRISLALDEHRLRVMRLIEPWQAHALTLPKGHRLLNLNTPQVLAAAQAD